MSHYGLTHQYRHPMEHSVQALPLMVELDGMPAPNLEVVEIVRQAGSVLNCARFQIQPEPGGSKGRWEELTRAVEPGHAVTGRLPLPARLTEYGLAGWPLFRGVICRGRANLRGALERAEVEACDELVYRDRRILNGIRICGDDHTMVWEEGAEAVFNPDGTGNRSEVKIQRNAQEYYIFEQDMEHAEIWRYEDAIEYLAEEYLGRGVLGRGAKASIRNYSAHAIPRDVSVTGLTALEAMDRLCEEAGLVFAKDYVPGAGELIIEAIRFCGKGCGRRLRWRHQKAGESLDFRRTNLAECTVETKGIVPEDGQEIRWRESGRMDLTGEAVIPWLAAEILPGDVIGEVEGRGLSMEEVRRRRGSLPQVKRVILRPGRWETVIQFGE